MSLPGYILKESILEMLSLKGGNQWFSFRSGFSGVNVRGVAS